MTVTDLIQRFDEIPAVLHQEPALARFAEVFDPLLQQAMPPSPCQGSQHTAGNKIYIRLITPMGILNYGLSTPEKTVTRMQALMEEYLADQTAFVAATVPPDTPETPGGCQDA